VLSCQKYPSKKNKQTTETKRMKTNYTPESLHEIFVALEKDAKPFFSYNKKSQNVYDYYISKLQADNNRVVDQGERHHILPKHAGGTDDLNNLILLTPTEHLIAHWVRWEVYKENFDRYACAFRLGDTEMMAEVKREAIIVARFYYKTKKQVLVFTIQHFLYYKKKKS
jgi:hypothetical protein